MRNTTSIAMVFAVGFLLSPIRVQAQQSTGIPAQAPATATDGLHVTASVKPNPPRIGDNTLDLFVTDSDGKPVIGLKISTRVEMMSMDMGVTKPPIKEVGGGHYTTTATFSMAGPWRVGLRGQTADGGKFSGPLSFSVGEKGLWKSSPLVLVINRASNASPAPSAVVSPSVAPASAMPTQSPFPIPLGNEESKKTSTMNMESTGDAMKPGMVSMTASRMPQLKEKRVMTVAGDENWKTRTGFGKNYGMVAMMTGMMVEGTGLDKMKMDVMKMDFSDKNFIEDEDDKAQVATAPPAPMVSGEDAHPIPTPMKSEGEVQTTPLVPAVVSPVAPTPTTAPAPSKAQGSTTAVPVANPVSSPHTDSTSVLKITAKLQSSPKTGDNKMVITILDNKGLPVTGAKVTIAVAMTSMDMGTTHPAVKEMGKGVYVTTTNFSMAGPWRIFVKVTILGQKPQILPVDVTIK